MAILKPISISLSPNTERDDVLLALRLYIQPWRWKRGNAIEHLEQEFRKYLGASYAISFNSGRSAFLSILKSLDLQKGDEVLIQAFTCNAVPNPVLWAGFNPVYVDCDESYNMDVEDLQKKITSRSRVVLVQHTFGLPADMERIQEVCKKQNLILLEDCAHSLGAEYGSTSSPQAKRKKVGTFGKASFFSFSRDKVISSVYGGMVTTNDTELAKRVRAYQEQAGYPSFLWIEQQVLHPWLMNFLILPTYRIFGKYVLVAAQLIHMLSKAVHLKEKQGRQPGYFPKRLPNVLAELALLQFGKLEKFNNHRKELATFYSRALANTSYKLPTTSYESNHIFLRFSIQHPKAHEIIKRAWRQNLLLGDWYTSPVAPDDTRLDALRYEKGSCPNAEKLSQVTLNLPTHIRISKKDAEEVVDFLKYYEN